MSESTWVETLINSQVDGPALASSSAATSLLPGAAKLVLPSNYFTKIGKKLRIKGFGRISNIVTTPGTFTLDVRLNATPIVVFNGGAMQMSSTAHTNVPFEFEINLTARAIGSGTTATLIGLAKVTSQALSLTAVADPTTTMDTLLAPATAPAVGTGFDSTAANLLDLFGTFSISNAANAFTLHDFSVESLN